MDVVHIENKIYWRSLLIKHSQPGIWFEFILPVPKEARLYIFPGWNKLTSCNVLFILLKKTLCNQKDMNQPYIRLMVYLTFKENEGTTL